VMEVWRIR